MSLALTLKLAGSIEHLALTSWTSAFVFVFAFRIWHLAFGIWDWGWL